MRTRTVLVTGGAGYIGSHACVALLADGHRVITLDNHANSTAGVIDKIEKITGKNVIHICGDVRDEKLLVHTMTAHGCDAVMHFAGLKAVGESSRKPLDYHGNNVGGTLAVMKAMEVCGVDTLLFSSSATVYGSPQSLPLGESHRLAPDSPYGKTKWIAEEMIRDWHQSRPDLKVAILRYFNPIGAHESGLIGEDPFGDPNNLMPYLTQVATGRRPYLTVHGDDYDTPDGTGVRDYIHVVDLVQGHIAALHYLDSEAKTYGVGEMHLRELLCLNLGTGKGCSVFELMAAFEAVSGLKICYRIGPRRPGDLGSYYADSSRAKSVLGWKPTKTVVQMCKDSWNFAQPMSKANAQSITSPDPLPIKASSLEHVPPSCTRGLRPIGTIGGR